MREGGVDGKLCRRGCLCLLQQRQVAIEIGNVQLGQAMLPITKEIAWSAQLEILVCNAEAVIGAAQHL